MVSTVTTPQVPVYGKRSRRKQWSSIVGLIDKHIIIIIIFFFFLKQVCCEGKALKKFVIIRNPMTDAKDPGESWEEKSMKILMASFFHIISYGAIFSALFDVLAYIY